LLDAPSLRRLAAYCGLCAHLPLLRQRGALSAQMRRQAQRVDDDAVDFVLERVPQLTEIRMDATVLRERPAAAGHVVLTRGYRLLLGLVAGEGDTALLRTQHKLPRRVSSFRVAQLEPRQRQQLAELTLSCIVPERLPQWDWLF
jgi:type III secretion protein K